MTNREQGRGTIEQRFADLEAALDAYGADRTRWPAPVRHGLSAFIAESADAQRIVGAAEIFDRLLDSAPTLTPERLEALSARIGAAAARQPRLASDRGRAFGGKSAPSNLGFGRRENGWAAAALAASLVLGILAGQSPAIDPATTALIETTSSGDGGSQQMALVDDADTLLDEDLL